MKPLEVTSTGEGEMECELHSKEFFVQVGMLVIEGRTPQDSERGRIEGKHVLQGKSRHICQDKDEECQEAKTWVQQIEHHWQNNQPITIDVLVQLTDQTDTVILLEQWTVSILSSSNNQSTSGSQLLQAVRSHIHFSQLSAWLSLSKGSLPYSIEYRLGEGHGCFIQEPTQHVFPLASLPSQQSLQVIVKSLPRCSLQDLIDKHDSFSIDAIDNDQPCGHMKTLGKSEHCRSERSEIRLPCLYKKTSENLQLERTFTPEQTCYYKKPLYCNKKHSPDRSENGCLYSFKKPLDTTEQSSSETSENGQPCSFKNTFDDSKHSVSEGSGRSNNKQFSSFKNSLDSCQQFSPDRSNDNLPFTELYYNGKPMGTDKNTGSPCSDTRSPLRKRTCLKEVTSGRMSSHSSDKLKELSALSNLHYNKQTSSLERDFLHLEKEDQLGLDSNTLGACCANWESNGIMNLNERIEKLGNDIDKIEREITETDERCSGLSMLLKESRITSNDFSSTKDSVLKNTKLWDDDVQSKDKQRYTKDVSKMLLHRKYRSLNEQGTSSRNGSAGQQLNLKQPRPSRHSPTRHGSTYNSSDVDIHAIKQPVDKACFRRSVQLPISACTEPVFNPKTGLPVSSSPAPLRRSTNELYEDNTDFSDGLYSKVNYRELYKLLSRSAPASTTQSLLVNFEESVLNGRMEPVGTVEGFTAELSASGSFCPRHVKLPIISCFYRLSDDDAPSPYMGYISLKDEPLGRRGYHVPKKGTIQLTVFNPNKTVVKMFVVLYDCSDMPPKSQTFLRQKTYSALKENAVKNEAQQTLHYLLHLRFASSKSGKIYLHTDIRVIFARQPPDLGHLYQLYTITDGPTDPKYTRRYHTVMDPEC